MYMELFTIQHSSTYLFSQIHLDFASGPGLNIASNSRFKKSCLVWSPNYYMVDSDRYL